MESFYNKVLDFGHVALIDYMGDDSAVTQAARVSYVSAKDDEEHSSSEDETLIRYLRRHMHTTPFEMVTFKFHCKMPLFVARQWIRHRTGSFNEISGRYSVLKDEFYIPEVVRGQSKSNKQGSSDEVFDHNVQKTFKEVLEYDNKLTYLHYTKAVDVGVAKEMARIGLPLNLYTEWYWKVDLHNLLHFLALRCDSHAQWEVQQYGNKILDVIRQICPVSVQAWEDYHPMRGAMLLTALEIACIKSGNDSIFTNKREKTEWLEKKKRLGL